MAGFDMKGYARRGAEARLPELNQELEAIFGAFPDLRQSKPGRGASPKAAASAGGAEAGNGRALASDAPVRRRKPMSAAQKKAVGLRMKKYWAERRRNAAK